MKKVPLRRCLGCYESKPKKELCRIVRKTDGEICVDKTGKINGRGAYICYNAECLEKAMKAKRLEKEFGAAISEEVYETLRRDMNS
ncbi:MAG: YlxR family protein [Clostridia bacterium]|nr:YlxR family protein [Clostridia bacterium]